MTTYIKHVSAHRRSRRKSLHPLSPTILASCPGITFSLGGPQSSRPWALCLPETTIHEPPHILNADSAVDYLQASCQRRFECLTSTIAPERPIGPFSSIRYPRASLPSHNSLNSILSARIFPQERLSPSGSIIDRSNCFDNASYGTPFTNQVSNSDSYGIHSRYPSNCDSTRRSNNGLLLCPQSSPVGEENCSSIAPAADESFSNCRQPSPYLGSIESVCNTKQDSGQRSGSRINSSAIQRKTRKSCFNSARATPHPQRPQNRGIFIEETENTAKGFEINGTSKASVMSYSLSSKYKKNGNHQIQHISKLRRGTPRYPDQIINEKEHAKFNNNSADLTGPRGGRKSNNSEEAKLSNSSRAVNGSNSKSNATVTAQNQTIGRGTRRNSTIAREGNSLTGTQNVAGGSGLSSQRLPNSYKSKLSEDISSFSPVGNGFNEEKMLDEDNEVPSNSPVELISPQDMMPTHRRVCYSCQNEYLAFSPGPAPPRRGAGGRNNKPAHCPVCADLFERHGLRCTACCFVPAENFVDDGQLKCERCFGGTYTCDRL